MKYLIPIIAIATASAQEYPVNVVLPIPTRALPALSVITPDQYNASVAIDLIESHRKNEQTARETEMMFRILNATPEQ